MDARICPVHQSLVRPSLIAGVERRIVVLEGTLALLLVIGVGINPATVAAALFIGLVLHPLLARVSKADPYALAVYARSVRHQAHFLRAAHPAAPLHIHLPLEP